MTKATKRTGKENKARRQAARRFFEALATISKEEKIKKIDGPIFFNRKGEMK